MQRETAGEGEMTVDEGVDPVAATRYIPARGIAHDRAGKLLLRGLALWFCRIR
jgi:hypothetical protein